MEILCSIVLLITLKAVHSEIKTDYEVRNMLKDMLQDYDPKLRPHYLGPPVNISVDATILSFTNLDAINMMYTVDMFFRQRWMDHRLQHKLPVPLTIIVGTKHPSDIIWTPDTVFINSVTSAMHHVTVNNHKLDIYPNGSVFWGTRVTVSPSCFLDLKAYPMDKQKCMFEILSYAYGSKHLRYEWSKEPGVIIMDTRMAQFNLVEFTTDVKEYTYVAGNYTVLLGFFEFERLMGFAILQIYIPSIAVVCVSWISLWIRRNATPARVALCITTLLTISTIWSAVNATLPRVNYVKAIDIFLMTSFVCVIFTLLEYTVVLNSGKILNIFRKRRKKSIPEEKMGFINSMTKQNGRTMVENGNIWTSLDTHRMETIRNRYPDTNKKEKEVKCDFTITAAKKKEEEENEKFADRIEMFARVFFPLVYTTFNVFYWLTYLRRDVEE
ncbi:gamma-aminobutyric acid receptor subunit beta-2-like [Hydractinia symbiolongicarpus]|uniref:gamma-aminobutyric acid receptor subunit beta-2-like n=1 Tax=Hydractinia symbiolongicarpus TaxID=13093 RepID=UPI00254EA1E9|nr:gamma-aminobutyric acid receptor subunit beta-2-like [Hydractinia symbiolongicarpus]XP_057292920.1 gamma-aminobutyric acid receptor subunit beta-2-like [Hydractinia symbiolongicarpus]XP_057292921.1 gamma-aminobutyric acid receptor subunit beta-2-like [Hydractinia symbiolongicarpus]